MATQTTLPGSVGHIGNIMQAAAVMAAAEERFKLEETTEITAARQTVTDCKAAIGEAQKVVDEWVQRLDDAKTAADEAERSAGQSAFDGSDLGELGAAVASRRAAVEIAGKSLNLAGQALEQSSIDLELAKCDLMRLQIQQKQQRAEADTKLVHDCIAELEARPGGLHCAVKVSPVSGFWEQDTQLIAAEQRARQRQAQLNKARGAK